MANEAIQTGTQVLEPEAPQPLPRSKPELGMVIRAAAQLSLEEWPDERISAVRAYVGKEATNMAELSAFLATCKRYSLDPMVGQLFLIKSDSGPKVTTGRDTWLTLARREKGYGGILFGTVHQNDEFGHSRREDGTIILHHVVAGVQRGALIGGFCLIRDQLLGDNIEVRELKDFNHLLSKNNWKNYKADMVQNRCIAAVLRKEYGFPGLLITGEEDELDPPPPAPTGLPDVGGKGTAGLEAALSAKVKAANAKRTDAIEEIPVKVVDIGNAPEAPEPEPERATTGAPVPETATAEPEPTRTAESFASELGEFHHPVAQVQRSPDPAPAGDSKEKAEQFRIWTKLELKGAAARTGMDNTMLESIDAEYPEFRAKYGSEGK